MSRIETGSIVTMTAAERNTVEVLYADWARLLRCTNVEQAMARAGVAFEHNTRLRIAEFLLSDGGAQSLMRWAPHAYVLTNAEKLAARQLLRRFSPGQTVPAQGAEACDALRWVGFLRAEAGEYRLAEDLERFREGLGLYFHEVELPERGERFNTNCVPDFFIMTHRATRERAIKAMRTRSDHAPVAAGAVEGMSAKMMEAVRETASSGSDALAIDCYEEEVAILNDACGWTDEPVRLVMARGRAAEVTPESAWYLVGGG